MLKKKGPMTRKPVDPKRKAKAKRLLDSKQLLSENQEILLKFDKNHPGMTLDETDAVLTFVRWLEDKDYIIFDAKRMVRMRLEVG
ncbi:hypothetical protein LCGC14_1818870 [marine sediment metagenome]|uniref:Uncharacterized protein n=1 Tax=marine sediment metagenome TaxID=412755 RepID=A0A0F9GJK7_9ZZZZ|nr:hypothetical protein [Candidatus Aminicenantes bacterium]HEB35924.1 hypothetical protein [Candidatus Aminicenantes bacterium]